MSAFIFNGDWETQLSLDLLSSLRHERFYIGSYSSAIREKLLKGIVGVRILEYYYDTSPDPTPAQFNTIQYIHEHQEVLLSRCFDRVINVEYPSMKELIDTTEYWFPEISTAADLVNVLGIQSIDILNMDKDGYAYYALNFYSSWDDEHGCNFLFYKDTILAGGDAGAFNVDVMCEHAGKDCEKYIDDVNNWQQDVNDYIQPHPKYGKLKPIEEQANHGLAFRLAHKGRTQILTDHINNGTIHIDEGYVEKGSGVSLLEIAVRRENEALVAFLTEKGIRNVGHALRYAKNENIHNMVSQYYENNKANILLPD